jgi:cellulose synthase/poly-beta-1,6-N-acetylglucosamine synthase-like glycosyltransferase
MTALEAAVLSAYMLTLAVLALYGCHRFYLLRLHRRECDRPPRPTRRLERLPRVTVQLPIYNELYVVDRLIRAACALDYPADRLEIQVLDDSTDETSRIAETTIGRMRARGIDIVHLRRRDRQGYKAGALAYGLSLARGEFIAVFDADFLPGPSFLQELIHYFANPRVGMVQARWDHLNRDYSLLTRLQSILLDGHFVIEHGARAGSGRFFNFNGTAGIWRRTCIESAGGWESDTLTEDLDLSYRAQLRGWRFLFAPHVLAPAELPADIRAFKSQQRRWARGAIETGLKILPRLLRTRLPGRVKLEAVVHLTNNSAYALMVLLAILIVPAMIIRHEAGLTPLILLDLPLFLMSTISVSAFYVRSQGALGRSRLSAVMLMPFLLSLGIGLSLNNARGVLGAFGRRRVEFVRTPKHDLRGRSGGWRHKRYTGTPGLTGAILELLFGLYFTGAVTHALLSGLYAPLPFLLLFQFGYLYAALLSVTPLLRDQFAFRLPRRRRKALTEAS